MTTSFHRGSAKIYQFPVRARATDGSRREEVKPAADLVSPRVCEAASGHGWYHEAAIQEAEQARKQ